MEQGGAGEFTGALRGLVNAVMRTVAASMPRLRWATVVTASPLRIRYTDDYTIGTATPLKPYTPSSGDNVLVMAFSGYTVVIGAASGAGGGGLPVGTGALWWGRSETAPPAPWLLLEGQSLAISDYPELYAFFGGPYYGAVDSNHFNLPSALGRVVVHLDGSVEFPYPGAVAGERKHKLTPEETVQSSQWLSSGDYNPALSILINQGSSYGAYTAHRTPTAPHNNLPPYVVGRYMIKAR